MCVDENLHCYINTSIESFNVVQCNLVSGGNQNACKKEEENKDKGKGKD